MQIMTTLFESSHRNCNSHQKTAKVIKLLSKFKSRPKKRELDTNIEIKSKVYATLMHIINFWKMIGIPHVSTNKIERIKELEREKKKETDMSLRNEKIVI
jgi:hypothetical protein